ncbi:MAG: ATP-binding protein [Candidatus Methanoperedens sp.]|nr:ATP-binding protein [Candidatus Methanoperedens sp.]
MMQQFINRDEELNILEERFISKKTEFIVMYGRRRVGKTELAVHFIRDKPGIYFLAGEKADAENLEEMKGVMADFLKNDEFRMIKFENWVQLFKSFSEKIRERTVIIMDEFPYLVKENKSVPSEFQKIWDMHLSKNDKIMLIIVGSSVGMMEKLLGSKSPLFGRRTAQLEIKPVSIFQVRKFLPGYSMEDCITTYGCTDGIPLYLNQFDPKISAFENIKNNFFRKDALLYGESDFLLRQEFREPANYFAILKAISFGYVKQNEIVSYTNIDKSIISKYLQNLEEIRVITREFPVTEKKEKRKNNRYVFSDNYFRFWFRFVYPNRMLIEKRDDGAFASMKKTNNMYLGAVFEKVASEFLWETKPFRLTRLGRWWHKDKEIDLVALNENENEIYFIECKWMGLSETRIRKLFSELKEKSQFVDWNKDAKKHYVIIAKKAENKKIHKKEGNYLFDMEDMIKLTTHGDVKKGGGD